MSSIDEIGTPTRPTSPIARARVGVVAHLGREVERDREPGLALLQQVPETAVGVGGVGEARVLAHRPEPAAVHGRLHAPGEGELPGMADVAVLVDVGDVGGRVEIGDLDVARAAEVRAPFGVLGESPGAGRRAPAVATGVGGWFRRGGGPGRTHPVTIRVSARWGPECGPGGDGSMRLHRRRAAGGPQGPARRRARRVSRA